MYDTFPEECLLECVKHFCSVRELGQSQRVCRSWNKPASFEKLVLNLALVPFKAIAKLYRVADVLALRIIRAGVRGVEYVQQILHLFPNIKVLCVPTYRGLDLALCRNLRFLSGSGPNVGCPESYPETLAEIQLCKYIFIHDLDVIDHLVALPALHRIYGPYAIDNFSALTLCNNLKHSLLCDIDVDDIASTPAKNVYSVLLSETEATEEMVSKVSSLPNLEQLIISQTDCLKYTFQTGGEWPALRRVLVDNITPELLQMLKFAVKLDTLVLTHVVAVSEGDFPVLPQVKTIVYQPRRQHKALWFLYKNVFPQLHSMFIDEPNLDDFSFDPLLQVPNLYVRNIDLITGRHLKTLGNYASRVFLRGYLCKGEYDLSGETVWYLPLRCKPFITTRDSNVNYLDDEQLCSAFEKFDEVDAGQVFKDMFNKYKNMRSFILVVRELIKRTK